MVFSSDSMPPKKKVLYVITKGNFGGAQRYVYDLATSLPKDQFTASVAHGEGRTLPDKLQKARIKTIQIESLQRDISFKNEWRVFRELVRIFKKEKPDIVHLNSSKIGAIGALAVRIFNLFYATRYKLHVTCVFTAHGWAFKEERPFFGRIAIKFISWLTVILSHKTIVVSKDDFEKSKSFPFCRKKITMIHNGISNISFKDGFEARQFLGNNIEQSTWIGTMSELHPNKGLDRLIRAYAEIAPIYKDSALVIIGGGQEELELKKLTHFLKIEKQVFFLGHIDNASQYLKAFDIFTLTSRKEGLPYALLEAGRAELPIIASNVGGIPEIIKHGKTGLLIKDEKEIWSSLNRLLSNGEERKLFGKELKQTIQNEFDVETFRTETFKIYRKNMLLVQNSNLN